MSPTRTLTALLMLAPVALLAPEPPATDAAPPVRVSPPPAPFVPAAAAAIRFRWPLDGTPVVVRRFDPPPRPWLPGHRGVDLSAPAGSAVRAAGAGVVRFAGILAGRGVVSVDHPGGLRTTYEPVTPAVRAGDRVAAGEQLGVLDAGHPGCPAPACLHWGLRRGGEYLDPLAMLGLARVRLLPVPGRRRLRRHGRRDHLCVSRVGRPSASRSYSSARL